MKRNIFFLMLFGIAFGFVEATVVFYLRQLFDFSDNYLLHNYDTLLNIGVIAFILPKIPILQDAQISAAEMQREVATIVMLFAVAFLSAQKWKQRIGAFLITFAFWDIFYYVFLKYLTGWPKTLFDIDVYFLVPVAWIGPVITPLVASVIITIIGILLYRKK